MADNGKLATVFGGSGFVGRHIVWRWRSADIGCARPSGGPISRAICNRWASSVRFMPFRPICDLQIRSRGRLKAPMIVINAVGILAPTGAQTFEAVHAEGARRVAKAAREAGAARLVHISAIGADNKSSARYARTKAEGEEAASGGISIGDHPAAIDRVRPGGRVLQSLCGDGAH